MDEDAFEDYPKIPQVVRIQFLVEINLLEANEMTPIFVKLRCKEIKHSLYPSCLIIGFERHYSFQRGRKGYMSHGLHVDRTIWCTVESHEASHLM